MVAPAAARPPLHAVDPRSGVIQLQRSAGNAAVSRYLLQRDETGTSAREGGRTQAQVLPRLRLEDLFRVYVATEDIVSAGGASFTREWTADNLQRLKSVIRTKLDAKAAEGRTEHLQYFVDYVEELEGDAARKRWLVRAIDHRLAATTSSTASAIADTLGDAAEFGIRNSPFALIAGRGEVDQAVRAARASIRNGSAFVDGLLDGLDRELDADELPALTAKLVACNITLLGPGLVPFTAGALVGFVQDLDETLRDLLALDREKLEQMVRMMVQVLFEPEGEQAARTMGFELATQETRKIVRAMDSSVVTILYEYGRAVGPIVGEALLTIFTSGAGAAAARFARSSAMLARLARRMPQLTAAVRELNDMRGFYRGAVRGELPPRRSGAGVQAPDGEGAGRRRAGEPAAQHAGQSPDTRRQVDRGERPPPDLPADDRRWEEGISPATRRMLRGDDELADMWHDMDPAVRRVLTHCSDVCIPANATRGQVRRLRRVLDKIPPQHRDGLREFLYEHRDRLDDAIRDLDELFSADLGAAVDDAIEALERGELPQRERLVQVGREGTAPGDVPDIEGSEPGQRVPGSLLARTRVVLGKKIADAPESVQAAWREAVEGVLARSGPLTADNYERLYRSAQRGFWRRVRRDAQAAGWFRANGFSFATTRSGAPAVALPHERRMRKEFAVELDHVLPKATGDNWRRALDADNLSFTTGWDNWLLNEIERAAPALRRGASSG